MEFTLISVTEVTTSHIKRPSSDQTQQQIKEHRSTTAPAKILGRVTNLNSKRSMQITSMIDCWPRT